MIIKFIGAVLYFAGIVATLWGLYTLVSTMLGFNNEVAFAGAIAGIGFVAIIAGLFTLLIGKILLK